MANYANLLATIAANIYTNGNNEVTAAMVKAVVEAMVNSLGYGYQLRGAAKPTDNPGILDQRVCFIASTPGVYYYFGGLSLSDNEVALLKWDSAWSKETLDIPSKTQIMARLSTQDGRLDEQDTEIADFEAAVQDQIDNYPMITINGNVTNAPDEEDITTDENDLLKFKNRSAVDGMGYVVLRKGGSNTFASQVTEANTIYEIRYDFDLDGLDVTIPIGSVLRFNGGSITNGVVYLSDNCKIEGSGKFIIQETQVWQWQSSGGGYDSKVCAIVCQAVKNISIDGVSFSLAYDVSSVTPGEEYKKYVPAVVGYGYRSEPSENLTIRNCRFEDCGVAFWGNTNMSAVVGCVFAGEGQMVFANETLYDMPRAGESLRPWSCPKDNAFIDNIVSNDNTDVVDGSLMWCSGVDGLDISGNNFASKNSLIALYCGDDSVSMKNARVTNNTFRLKGGYVTNACPLGVIGLSWPWPIPANKRKSDVLISGNSFIADTKNYPSLVRQCSAISLSFLDFALVKNNEIAGFSNAISASTTRTSGGVVVYELAGGEYIVKNNHIHDIYYSPVGFPANSDLFLLEGNIFENVNAVRTSWPRIMFDISGCVNVQIIDNLFPNLTYTPGTDNPWIAAASEFRCVIKGNIANNVFMGCRVTSAKFLGCFEYGKNYFYGSWGKELTIPDSFNNYNGIFFNEGAVISFTNPDVVNVGGTNYKRSQVLVTKGGTLNSSMQITGAAGDAGSRELTYGNNNVAPGSLIVIDTTIYEVLFVYKKIVTVPSDSSYNESKDIIVLNNPLHRAVSNETLQTQQCAFINLSLLPNA